MSTTPGTIDITDTVTKLQSTFVTWAVAYIYGLEIAVPELSWVATPGISQIDQELLKSAITALSNSAIMAAFFLNTVVRKASQAQDYVNVVNTKLNLPPTTSQEDYAKAEAAECAAFRDFVALNN